MQKTLKNRSFLYKRKKTSKRAS